MSPPKEKASGDARDNAEPEGNPGPRISYSVRHESNGDSAVVAAGIVAERKGETFIVVPPNEGACLSVILQRDLDGDGLTDALLENALSCGGNLTPPYFMFVAGTASGDFHVQDLDSQWERPTLETWQGRPSIVIVTSNEGMNLDRPQQVTRRFVFEQGKAVVVEEIRAVETDALADLRAEQFETVDPDDEMRLSFDLDGDGKQDYLVGTLWARWGRINWHVLFADGRISDQKFPACKRIGVLQHRTKGYQDLVCDFDTQFRWNGNTYEAAPR